MSLQLVRIVLFLSFLSIVSAETHPSTSSPFFSVIQMPLFVNVTEGSDVTLSCNMEGNVPSKWFVNWMKMGEKGNIKNSTRTFVTTNNISKSSILTLKSTVIADSGIYRCEFGSSRHLQSGYTSVTVWEKPYMVVRQTPVEISRKVGANVTIMCNFNRVDNLSLLEVKWYKDTQELRNPKHTVKLKQKAFLILVNVNLEDSGNYVCSIRIRNRTGSGNGTQVHVTVSAETHLSTSSPFFSLIQTPLFVNVSEGSDVTLSCNMEGNVSSKWFVNWMKMGKKGNIKNSNRTFVTTNNVNKSSIITLTSAVIADSGTYRCVIGNSGHLQSGYTSMTVWGHEKNIEVNGDDRQPGSLQENTISGIILPVVVGAAMGKFVLLLLLGAMVWRLKRKNKGGNSSTAVLSDFSSSEGEESNQNNRLGRDLVRHLAQPPAQVGDPAPSLTHGSPVSS